MLTLRELKNMAEIPPEGRKTPTVKELRISEKPIVEQTVGADAEIAAYKSGYAVYCAGGAATVFRIHPCGGYSYGFEENSRDISSSLFEDGAWHLRLVLEGEDRLCRNREAKAQVRTVSYGAVLGEWGLPDTGAEPALERIVREEAVDALLSVLSGRQRQAVIRHCLEHKTNREIAEELGVTASAVSRMLAKSLDRMRAGFRDVSGSGGAALEGRCV